MKFLTIIFCFLFVASTQAETRSADPSQAESAQAESVSPDSPDFAESEVPPSLREPSFDWVDQERKETPYSQEYKKDPKPKKKPKKKKVIGPPHRHGNRTGRYWIGQRIVTKHHAGWGWLKEEDDSWRSAKWVMVQEKPGITKVPGRFHAKPSDDHNMQYRFYGHYADYKGYEPNVDSLVPVFVLKGFEVIGHGGDIQRDPPSRTGARRGSISTRGVNSRARFGRR